MPVGPSVPAAMEVFHVQLRQIERRANIVLLMQMLLTLITAVFCIVMLATRDDNATTTLYSSLLSWILGWWIQSPMGGSARVAGMGSSPEGLSPGMSAIMPMPSLGEPGPVMSGPGRAHDQDREDEPLAEAGAGAESPTEQEEGPTVPPPSPTAAEPWKVPVPAPPPVTEGRTVSLGATGAVLPPSPFEVTLDRVAVTKGAAPAPARRHDTWRVPTPPPPVSDKV